MVDAGQVYGGHRLYCTILESWTWLDSLLIIYTTLGNYLGFAQTDAIIVLKDWSTSEDE